MDPFAFSPSLREQGGAIVSEMHAHKEGCILWHMHIIQTREKKASLPSEPLPDSVPLCALLRHEPPQLVQLRLKSGDGR